MKQDMWDVVVVGGGPSGSAAAKRCAEFGLKTLLLEKYKIPRRKVCTGALMASDAQVLVREVFGELPQDISTTVEGFIVYSPDHKGRVTDHKMPLTWRYDLDYWMNQEAVKAGCELWEQGRANGIAQENDTCILYVQKGDRIHEIVTKFVIGADGTNSTIRRSIFPDFKPRYMHAFQEVYQTKLNLDPNYIHWYVLLPDRNIFEVHQKTWNGKDVVVLDANGRPGERANREEIIGRAKNVMAKEFGFDLNSELLWTDGCIDAMWLREAFSGEFTPAKGSILLAGDASGIRMPVTSDGIGTGIKCALMAADAINKAVHGQGKAMDIYLSGVKRFLSELEKLMPPRGYLKEEGNKGPGYLLDAYKKIYDTVLKFESTL
jgi:flavin-dependent dehydrogenase